MPASPHHLNGGSAGDRLVGGDGADQINGGSGADELFGGEGADQINGGDENDEIKGDGGDDRIVGGTGSDKLKAEAGDDAIVWNNGDGSDPVNEGGAGFDRVDQRLPRRGRPHAVRCQRDRSVLCADEPVPFTLEFAPDNEVLAFNGLGGNDAFKVHDGGSAMTVAADGGAGNDELSGADEVDSFFGGSGNDLLTGGAGSDLLDGQEGEDRMLARDGFGDLVRGGVGNDSAQTDRITVDAVDGVETLEATPAPVPTPGPNPSPRHRPKPRDTAAILPTVGKVAVVRSNGKLIARAPVTCPAAEAGGCRTALTLETAKAVKLGKVRAALVLHPHRSSSLPARARPSRSGSIGAPRASPATASSRPASRSRAPTPPATRRREQWRSACESLVARHDTTPRRRPRRTRGLLFAITRSESQIERTRR